MSIRPRPWELVSLWAVYPGAMSASLHALSRRSRNRHCFATSDISSALGRRLLYFSRRCCAPYQQGYIRDTSSSNEGLGTVSRGELVHPPSSPCTRRKEVQSNRLGPAVKHWMGTILTNSRKLLRFSFCLRRRIPSNQPTAYIADNLGFLQIKAKI